MLFINYDNRIVRVVSVKGTCLQDLKSKEHIFKFLNEDNVLVGENDMK